MQLADLERKVEKLTAILEVAKGFSTVRSLDSLLDLVLREAAKVVEADRCSIFLVDQLRNELWTRAAQGTGTIRLPWGTGIAGHVAKTGETVAIDDAYGDPRFNRAIDQTTGYVTRNILCVPMRDVRGSIVGVLEALNHLDGPFTREDTEYLIAIGGQAASAIENAFLHRDNRELLEGFVGAAVVAIESRDPSTHGHSQRVATLSLDLAEVVNRESVGVYAETHFSREQMEELRLAALLHDFGKVGVRENILVKADKLFPHELEMLRARFDVARRSIEVESWRRRAEIAAKGASPVAAADEEARLAAQVRELEEVYAFILACNRPTVLPRGGFERLAEIARRTFADVNGQSRPLLTPMEVETLSIPKGSLSEDERREIESHVTWTYRFLAQIRWPQNLRRVPDIAYAHHEKLNGVGYPRRLGAETIPVEARIMTVVDIYDALTASDRPYKKAVPKSKAYDILKMEADAGQLDRELFRLFVEADVARRVLGHER